jgi:hypothetical protein
MHRGPKLPIAISWIALTILISGCDDRAAQIAREAADRQAQQNTAMVELNQEVAGGTRRLVEADAQARKELVGVHRDLQAERTRLDGKWSELENERQEVAADRRTESMLVPLVELAGGILLTGLLLGFCWYALVASRRGEHAETELNELLISEILTEKQSVIAPIKRRPSLLGQSQSDERSAE